MFIKYFLGRGSRRKLNKPISKIRINLEPLQKSYEKFYVRVIKIFDTSKPQEVKSADLIYLAMRNLSYKRNRTYVTIVGMAIGFGAVILLLSLGFGFERLVVSRVASLSEMKQIDVSSSQNSLLSFDSNSIAKIKEIPKVEAILPIVTSVSKVTYNNAVSDVIVYGVNTRYLEEVGLSPLKGALFKDGDLKLSETPREDGQGIVAGASTVIISNKSFGKEISNVKYSVFPLTWKPVYSQPNSKSQLIGYTKRDMGEQEAREVWGYTYTNSEKGRLGEDLKGVKYSPWIKDDFPLWEKKKCKMSNPDCIEGTYLMLRDKSSQLIKQGFISEDKVSVDRYEIIAESGLEVYSGKIIEEVSFNVKESDYTPMYIEASESSETSSLVANKDKATLRGKLIYGGVYTADSGYFVKNERGDKYGYWIKTDIKVWSGDKCEGLCDVYYTEQKESSFKESSLVVYLKASDVSLGSLSNVLGADTANDGSLIDLNTLKEEDGIDWVSISSELGALEDIAKDIKSLPEDAQKLAVVNSSMITLLGLDPNDAVGKKFKATIIFDSKLFNKTNYEVESELTEFEIFGVVSDSKTPTFYIPIEDLAVDGMVNVSQLKIVVEDKGDVAGVRSSIEGMGFQTVSVADTVDSITSLFETLRIALLVLGLIALGVASLGMFNTLTVSLLEKSREVGLLKTMGLKSNEVTILFLAESVIMSVFGGVAGLLLAFGIGKLISLLLTVLAIAQGQSALDVTYIPILLGAVIIVISSVVGVFTGWYPAKRAKDIPALNALRYE